MCCCRRGAPGRKRVGKPGHARGRRHPAPPPRTIRACIALGAVFPAPGLPRDWRPHRRGPRSAVAGLPIPLTTPPYTPPSLPPHRAWRAPLWWQAVSTIGPLANPRGARTNRMRAAGRGGGGRPRVSPRWRMRRRRSVVRASALHASRVASAGTHPENAGTAISHICDVVTILEIAAGSFFCRVLGVAPLTVREEPQRMYTSVRLPVWGGQESVPAPPCCSRPAGRPAIHLGCIWPSLLFLLGAEEPPRPPATHPVPPGNERQQARPLPGGVLPDYPRRRCRCRRAVGG